MHTIRKDLVRGKNNHNVLKNSNRHISIKVLLCIMLLFQSRKMQVRWPTAISLTCMKKKKVFTWCDQLFMISSRRGIALQRNENNDNFTQLMMLLGTKDESIIAHLDRRIGNKYTHCDIQNELLNITSRLILLSKLETFHNFFFNNGRWVYRHHQ